MNLNEIKVLFSGLGCKTRTTFVVSNGRYTFYQIHFIRHNREFQQGFTTDLPTIYQQFTNDLPKIYQK